jgi:DNA-binding response OmpR family regulator
MACECILMFFEKNVQKEAYFFFSSTASMNILIVEDNLGIARYMQGILKKIPSAYLIEIEDTFNKAYNKAQSGVFDILLIDIHLKDSKYDGIDLVTSIRNTNTTLPILVVTTFTSLSTLERAFDAGVNDYITKPFRSRELELRVQQWFGYPRFPQKNKKIEYGDFSYFPKRNMIFCGKKALSLGKKSKKLFLLFLQYPETILSPRFLQEKLWGDYDLSKKRNIRSNIQILRKLLGSPYEKWIQNVRSEGYILKKEL